MKKFKDFLLENQYSNKLQDNVAIAAYIEENSVGYVDKEQIEDFLLVPICHIN